MNKQTPIILGITGLIVVLLIAVYFSSQKTTPQPVVTAKPTPVKVVEKPAKQSVTRIEQTPSPTPVPTPTPVAEGTPSAQAALFNSLDPTDINQIPLNAQEIANLVDEFGVVELYKRLYSYNRRTLQDHLFYHREMLRENTPALLGIEEDSNLRKLLLDINEPNYVPRESETYDETKIDKDFLKILEAPTPTAVSEEEWNARQLLAGLVSDEAALDFARRSLEQFPESNTVSLVASANLLKYGGDRAPVSSEEVSGAKASLKKILSSDNFFDSFPSEQRLMAYESLAKGADEQTIAFLRDIQKKEKIDHVAKALNAILP